MRCVVRLLVVVACCSGTAQGQGGLRMNYSRIAVDNLPIGHAVSMKRLVNLPLKIGNNYDFPIEVHINILEPSAVQSGYEPLVETDWIQPETGVVEIPAHEEKEVDVVISVPDDETLLGRRFQADVHVLTVGKRGARGVRTGYEITGGFLFSVAPQRNEMALQAALERPADGAFRLDPPRVDIFGVAPGDCVFLRTLEQQPVRLVNESTHAQQYELEPICVDQSAYRPDHGSQPMSPSDLQLLAASYALDSGICTNVEAFIEVPEEADLGEGPLLYLVAIRNGQMRSVEQYLKIYLWAEAEPPMGRP